jgi:predicted phosphodiesterase
MRIALFSDIHGNSYALDAVLADIAENGGVDAYWVLGDLAKLGSDPAGVLERLVSLENAVFVRGNTDHYLVTGTMPYPSVGDVEKDTSLLPRFEIVACQTGWTQGVVTAAGYFEWLAALPTEQRLMLPDGTRLLGVHASPGNHSGQGFHPNVDEATMTSLLDGCEADLVCVGHSHPCVPILNETLCPFKLV